MTNPSTIRHIPHSARIICAGCQHHYDYQDSTDRSCPECSCPPPTVRVHHDYGNGAGRGEIVANPAHAEFLREKDAANSTPPVSTSLANRPETVSTDGRTDRKAYMRELMRRKRAEKRGKP